MKKLFCFILLICFTAGAQTQPVKIKQVVSNTKTSEHINIPGTRLFIIPPPEFSVATVFLGLQKGETAMFTIYDLVGGNFYTNAATFSKESFEQAGARVFEFREITINGYPAKYIYMQGDPTAKVIGLVFGDTTFSTMIMALYPVNDEQTGNQIINSLNSICYDKSRIISPFETAIFSLNESQSRFKFFKYSSSIYIYTVDGKDNSSDKDEPMLLVTQLPIDNTMSVKSISDMMIGKAQQYGLTAPEIKNQSTERINGYEAYQAEVYGQMNGNASVIYVCTLAKGDKAIVIQGIAKRDLVKAVEEFRKLALTAKLK